MQDHGDLVYLDVPKTGSTFVVAFLKAACRLPLLGGIRHERIAGPHRLDAYYFATVRHPLAQYVSLFRYGLHYSGGVRSKIDKAGRTVLYQKGFDDWLAYMLDPAMATELGDGFEHIVKSGIGIMTYRFVALSMAYPLQTLTPARSIDQVRTLYDDRKLTQSVICMEELNEGLRRLALDEHPQWFDADAATQFLSGPRINASPYPSLPSVDPVLEVEVLRRERLVIDLFYSGDRQ
jgi:hypothetical protein